MRTVVVGQRPAEFEALLARRRALGQDIFDEMWEGVYHVAPASHAWHGYLDNVLAELLGPYARRCGLVGTGPFNLGEADDYRVPDRGYHRELPTGVWIATAAIVVEVISPDDETWEKFDFYARHGVDEICTAEPVGGELRWFTLAASAYEETGTSALLGVTAADITARIEWPHDARQ
ncbi:MAG TPA: Uma2 family endonuclease [Acidimicrobiales bacterium]|nr:Uma2 family endonuclease [Acidimicrobiales bacterium]